MPATDPTALFRRRDGIYASDLLVTAIAGLDFFTVLAREPLTLQGITERFGIAARPADVTVTLFVAMGLLQREGETLALTSLARDFLTADSPWSLGPYFASLKDRPICRQILDVLRTDHPFGWGSQPDEAEWARAMERDDFAQAFTAAMDSRGAYLAPALAQRLDCSGYRRLLDIAGGSGVYGCAIAEAHLDLEVAVLEMPAVLPATRRAIARRSLGERVSVIAGDMFADPLPRGFDIHLYSHVLHDWDAPAVQILIQKSFDALPPGGLIAIHDTHLGEDKSGPLDVAEYSVFLMLSTRGKCYSLGELRCILGAAGFQDCRLMPTAAYRSLILARKPH